MSSANRENAGNLAVAHSYGLNAYLAGTGRSRKARDRIEELDASIVETDDVIMSANRRKGAENSAVRLRLIECAEAIIRDEGYAALTAGRLAKSVGLSRHIVHYYFGTIEELFIAVMRHQGAYTVENFEVAFASGNPLDILWAPRVVDPRTFEMIAMALRSSEIKLELRDYHRRYRQMFRTAIERHFEHLGIVPPVDPDTIATILLNVSRALAAEEALGIDDGHGETRRHLTKWMESLDGIQREGC